MLLVALFAAGAFYQQRITIWLVMAAPWAAAPHWAAITERWAAARKRPVGVASFRKTLLGAALFFAAWMWSPAMMWVMAGNPPPLEGSISPGTPWQLARQLRDPQDPDAQVLPDLARVLKADYPEGRFTGAVFASETQGDYLIWALPDHIPVTLYTHVHLFPPAYWEEAAGALQGQPECRSVLRRRHANLVVVEAEGHTRLCQQIREDKAWVVVLDEAGDADKFPRDCRLFIAVRKKPV